MKLLFLALMVLFVGCSNDAVSGHEVVPIAGDISSSAVAPSSSSREIVEHSSSSSAENLSSAEESSSSSSESLSSSSESAESSSSSEQESSSSSVLEVKSSSSSSLVLIYGEMTDERDGQVYKTAYVEVINRTWMAENLNYAYLQPTAELDSSSLCYDNNPEKCEIYGRLYTWSAAMDSAAVFSDNGKGCGFGVPCTPLKVVRGVCPKGWHLPNESEWYKLLVFVYGEFPYGVLAKSRAKSNEYDESHLGLFTSYYYNDEYWTSVDYPNFDPRVYNDYEERDVSAGTVESMGVSLGYGIELKSDWIHVRCIEDYEIEE